MTTYEIKVNGETWHTTQDARDAIEACVEQRVRGNQVTVLVDGEEVLSFPAR